MPFAILSLDYCKRNEGKIGDVNQAIETLKTLSISDIKRQGTTPSERLAFVAAWYKNAVILRLRLLEGGASSEYNSRNFMSSAVLVRQLIETAAHFIATFIDVEKHLKKMPPGVAATLWWASLRGHLLRVRNDRRWLGRRDNRLIDPERGSWRHYRE